MQADSVNRMAINDIKKGGGHGGRPNKTEILYPYLLPLMQHCVGEGGLSYVFMDWSTIVRVECTRLVPNLRFLLGV